MNSCVLTLLTLSRGILYFYLKKKCVYLSIKTMSFILALHFEQAIIFTYVISYY